MAFISFETETNPYANLAAEELLLSLAARTGRPVLYLWQNAHTVVIGRNQNPWRECKVALLEGEGGRLARRKTGGGAVYHDMGNLNFSFAMPKALYDEDVQYGLIQKALRSFQIDAVRSGRNDLTIDGAKFSGNAFLHGEKASLHHGTLLIASDPSRVARYLTPPLAKLKAKGVASVASRVIRLQSVSPQITAETMVQSLAEVFSAQFGKTETPQIDQKQRDALAEEYASWDFRFGKTPPFDDEITVFAEKGTIVFAFSLKNSRVAACRAYADWLDVDLPQQMARALLGAVYEAGALAEALNPWDEEVASAMKAAFQASKT